MASGTATRAPALTDGLDLDVTFEAAGDDSAVNDAVRATRRGGKVVVVGIPRSDRFTLPAHVVRYRELQLTFAMRSRNDYPRALRLAAAGAVDLAGLVTARFPLERTPEAFESALRREGLKTVVGG